MTYMDVSTATLGSVGITPGTRAMVKVTHRMDNGAGNNEVKFWYSTIRRFSPGTSLGRR
jgi:hypothetical protein